MRTLTVVIPTLNEGKSIGPTIDAIPRDLDWLQVDIIVVDGDSTDATAAEAEKRGARVINEPRKGYGRAYKTGFAAATGEFIATLDGDTTYPAEVIPHVLALLLNRELDFITCNRLSMMDPNAMSMTHKVGNWSLAQATNILHGIHIHDSQSGMWIFRRRILKEIRLTSDGMPLSEEIKIETFRRGLNVLEIPVEYRARIGDVKLNTMEDGIRNLWFLLTKMADFR